MDRLGDDFGVVTCAAPRPRVVERRRGVSNMRRQRNMAPTRSAATLAGVWWRRGCRGNLRNWRRRWRCERARPDQGREPTPTASAGFATRYEELEGTALPCDVICRPGRRAGWCGASRVPAIAWTRSSVPPLMPEARKGVAVGRGAQLGGREAPLDHPGTRPPCSSGGRRARASASANAKSGVPFLVRDPRARQVLVEVLLPPCGTPVGRAPCRPSRAAAATSACPAGGSRRCSCSRRPSPVRSCRSSLRAAPGRGGRRRPTCRSSRAGAALRRAAGPESCPA